MSARHACEQTVTVVVAYVSKNAVSLVELPNLIDGVYKAFSDLSLPRKKCSPISDRKTAAQVVASCKYEWLISFIDGQPYKTLKRHLAAHGLTPECYRARYALPSDYPMVAPAYAARRSQIAKRTQRGYKAV